MKFIKRIFNRLFRKGRVMDSETINKKIELGEYYTPDQINDFLKEVGRKHKIIRNNKKISYYNIPCSFDIETTSTKTKTGDKFSTMYEWTLGINWVVMIGRNWEELEETTMHIVNHFMLHENKRLIIYVHNLSFEFQAFRKHFEWFRVFSLEPRKPVQAVTVDGIEFRCSYILSGYALAKIPDQLFKYKVKKMVGDLDYKLVRHSKTPLTDKEIRYCLNDVYVVMAYIQELIERDGDITKLPLTKTGFVRRHCKDNCYYEDKGHRKNIEKYHKYRNLMNELTIEPEEYKMLKQAFAGGFTHANPYFSRGVFTNVHSYDFTSAYPAVMIMEKFPMSKGEVFKIKSEEDFVNSLKNYCCLFEIKFKNIQPKIKDLISLEKHDYENYISLSHCRDIKNAVENNGRIVQADELTTTITELDYFIIQAMYDWDCIEIGKFIRYKKGYLPTDLVKSILEFYYDKTTLKGVEGKEIEYLLSKERINSIYGMCVTDICRKEINYVHSRWEEEEPDIDEKITKYNFSANRFLFYAWGIWVTAYNRYNLFTGIMEFNRDYIYSDTDSLKVKNIEKHIDYINNYNAWVEYKLEKAMKYHKLDIGLVKPKTIKGEVKILGVWDYEGCYSRFKTLGAKRYMTEKDGKISLTVSGVNKNTAIPYLLAKYGDKIFENFDEDLEIPNHNDLGYPIYDSQGKEIENPCGKMTHTYIDEEMTVVVHDYLGNSLVCQELSGTHLENAGYSLSLAQKYINYILGIQETDIIKER